MFLSKLSLINFKNYAELNVSFSSGVNCFVGDNGIGKTNLLDAIYYLSLCKSFFNSVDSHNIRDDEGFFLIKGEYTENDVRDELYCGVKIGQKKVFKRNKKEYERFSEHIGKYPIVMISPQDISLIYDGSDGRRKFVDGIISQYDHDYLENLIKYNRVLQQRNTLLKRFSEQRYFDKDSLDIWDQQLVKYGSAVHEKRIVFCRVYSKFVDDFYKIVSNDAEEKVEFLYNTKIGDGDFNQLLEQAIAKDRAVRHTSVGVHKDDFEFLLSGKGIKRYASQGQQKTFLIALKLAQYQFLKDHSAKCPVLLLDDIFDKLDMNRVMALLKNVCSDGFEQVFLTDTNLERTKEILSDSTNDYSIYMIEDGKCNKV